MKLIIALCVLGTVLSHFSQDLVDKYSIEIIKLGDSEEHPQPNNLVEVHYTGHLTNGNKFDSSKDRNSPFKFYVGKKQVITCWDEVVLSMAVGDHVKIKCPYQTAYGERSVGPIPAKSDLLFEI